MAKRKKKPSQSASRPGKSSHSASRPGDAVGGPEREEDKKPAARRPGKPSAGPEKATSRGKHPTFPIVGIGASAGGMEAFSQMLRRLSADTGMAFVFVQHLHPGYESALVEILSRETSMPVLEAKDDMAAQPDHVYVIPPGAYLGIQHGVLKLLPRPPARERRLPIDQFFRYLASDQGTRAIGVVLSGTGSDGVLGLKAIKAEGGITFAQDEASAKYDGMPHSAIWSGSVDSILPPDRIAAELENVARHPLIVQERTGRAVETLAPEGGNLDKLFVLMRRRSGHDFSYYKPTTIQRRIRRRMVLHKLERLEDYVRYLQDNPAELDELFHDILINVTDFFRDPEIFELLAQKVFPAMIPEKPSERTVRIWVPGCSSGEEPYSIAIALLEYLGERAATTPIQIFATDIDEVAIGRARAGIYPENITQDVSPERLRRFFTKVEGGYQVNKAVRDICVFAEQNVTRDPPFSRLDLISCRNVLIYLGPVLQRRVLRTFHYALKPNGFLLLGTAESIGDFGVDMFGPVDPKARIYTKKATVSPPDVEFGMPKEPPAPVAGPTRVAGGRSGDLDGSIDLQKEADRVLMRRYAPAGVVINENMEILSFHGRTGQYLEPTPGEASLNLLKMAREDLQVGLNAAVRESMATHAAADRHDIHLKTNGMTRRVDIDVMPLSISGVLNQYYLVVFRELPPALSRYEATKGGKTLTENAGEVERLQQELAATNEYLQSAIEQKEINNEELRSANEEIQSSNEELQSINEELETAKEELQSTNEELATVNDELESRNTELTRVNNDLSNLVASVDIPMLIVGQDLRVRRFTPQAEKLLNLIATDVGRPISDIKPNIEVPDFDEMIREAIDQLRTCERDVQDTQGRWYSLRARPYRTLDNVIDGAVVVFIDVDIMKRALDEARAARNYAEAIVTAVGDPMLVLDKDLRVVSASSAYLSTFRVTDKETRQNLVYRLGNGEWAIPRLREMLEQVITGPDGAFDAFTVTHEFERIGERTFQISGRQIPAGLPEGPMVLMQIEDITGDDGQGTSTA
ncbi:MAG: chemotaxis protein CheB [Arenicellales bacterium]